MRTYHTKAHCRGCKHEFPVSFQSRTSWVMMRIQKTCPNCESELEVQVKPALFRSQVQTRTQLIKHSQKLLEILGIKDEETAKYEAP